MHDFSGWEQLVEAMANARRIARDNAPRHSNDHIEAGMFLAMFHAFDQYMRGIVRDQPEPQPTEAPAPLTPPETSTEPPAVVTEEPEAPPIMPPPPVTDEDHQEDDPFEPESKPESEPAAGAAPG